MKKPRLNSQRKKTKNQSFARYITAFFFPIVFFLSALVLLPDYGMNWDSPVHFARGQAYLHYILTGKTDYNDLPPFCRGKDGFNSRVDFKTGEVCDKTRNTRVSEYESFILDFNWAKKDTYGHPAFSDLMLAASNQIFFKGLGWFEDVQSYHLYGIFLTFVLAAAVSYWALVTYGRFAAIIAGLSVYLFPLLFGEQFFNVKDPPLGSLFTLGIFFFWLGIVKKSSLLLIFSAITGGMSFATKINYVFAPIILLPWLLVYIRPYLGKYYKQTNKSIAKTITKSIHSIPKRILLVLFLYIPIVLLIFFASWPAMWFDTRTNLLNLVRFYQDIGVSTCPFPRFSFEWLLQCSNPLAISYVITTVPIITLIFFLVGFVVGIKSYKKYNAVTVLWIAMFLVTLLRVTLSISSIYGGIRQIMEIIAPIALLAGVGAFVIRERILSFVARVSHRKPTMRSTIVVSLLFLLLYIPLVFTLIKMHPNENVYYNELIGGLRGAKQMNFPGYGNSYGNAYWQGVLWLNQNAEKNAKLSLVTGLGQNLSRGTLRSDIAFLNGFRSAYNHLGEYQMLMIVQGDPGANYFRYKYVTRFLNPVYTLSVDGVSLLKIWKNDEKYVRDGLNLKDEVEVPFEESVKTNEVSLVFPSVYELKRLEFYYSNPKCLPVFLNAPILISSDGINFGQLSEVVNDLTVEEIQNYKAKRIFLFAGEEVKTIRFLLDPTKACDATDISYGVYAFEKLYEEK